MSNPYIEAILSSPDDTPEAEFHSSVRRYADDSHELYLIAEAFALVGNFIETVKLFQRIIEISPQWIDVFDLCARALWAIHEYDEASKMWNIFLNERKSSYDKLGIPEYFYTVDDVFTSAFGNFVHFHPLDLYGYRTNKDVFYHHRTKQSEGRRSELPAHNKVVANQALLDNVFCSIGKEIPADIVSLVEQDDYLTRLPFYCATRIDREPTHFHYAFSEKMLLARRSSQTLDIRYNHDETRRCEAQLFDMGVRPDRPIVGLHVRESGYWGRVGNRTNSTKNAKVTTYILAIKFLTDNGYQVIRLGDHTMTPLPRLDHVFDYALSGKRNDWLDLYILKRCAFLVCTCSGPFTVATALNVPVLATNWVPVHILPFAPTDLILLKRLKNKISNKFLSFDQMLRLDYGEFSYYNLQRKDIEVIDNTPDELLEATKLMVAKSHQLRQTAVLLPTPASSSSRFCGKAIISEAELVPGLV